MVGKVEFLASQNEKRVKRRKKEGAGDVLKDMSTRGGMRDLTAGNRWRDMGDVGCVL